MLPMRQLADAQEVGRLIEKLAEQIQRDLQAQLGAGQWALVGIRSRGDVLAQRLAQKLKPNHVGALDITLYRDDLGQSASQPMVRTTEINFPVDDLDIVLVDDVLMTGRSARAAIQSLIDLGRPRRVWLAVLVDRPGRELPIAADQVGLRLTQREAAPEQSVAVSLRPRDERDTIELRDQLPGDREVREQQSKGGAPA
jgi:pyrimidine operon attenuation protein / uracil phosphoribosyltransferase